MSKKWAQEFVYSYSGAYSFGYCHFTSANKQDCLADIYSEGYLPASNNADLKDAFYLCRSLRIDLKSFDLNSENRRVYKKFSDSFSHEIISLKAFEKDTQLVKLFVEYFKFKHGPDVMSAERLALILKHIAAKDVSVYRNPTGEPVACIINAGDATAQHFWFSAYDTQFDHQSLGMWLMIDAILKAKDAGYTHFYLGTGYGYGGRYKANFNNIEWWNGNAWQSDAKNKALKERIAADAGYQVQQKARG